jgi:hypothetical protein
VVIVVLMGIGSSISVSLFEFSKRNPIVPFGVGILMGHFFWPSGGGL